MKRLAPSGTGVCAWSIASTGSWPWECVDTDVAADDAMEAQLAGLGAGKAFDLGDFDLDGGLGLYSQWRPPTEQLRHAGRVSSHFICRLLHTRQPLRDFRCERRGLTDISMAGWLLLDAVEVDVCEWKSGMAGCCLSAAFKLILVFKKIF